MSNIKRTPWSEEEAEIINVIKESNPSLSYKGIADLLRERFGYDRTSESIRHFFRGNVTPKKQRPKVIHDKKLVKEFEPEEYLEDIIKLQKKHYAEFDSGKCKDEVDTHTVNVEFDSYEQPIAISFLADIHLGNPYCDYERVVNTLEDISANEQHYIYFGGDAIDNFIISKLGKQTDKQLIDVEKQWKLVNYLVEKYSDSIFAIGDGNHEGFTEKLSYINFNKLLTDESRFIYTGEEGAYFKVNVGGQEYKLHVMHKLNMSNSKLNRHLAHKRKYDFSAVPDLDVIVQEHFHEGDMETFWRHGKKRIGINCGTFKLLDEYAKRLSYDHVSNTTPTVVLFPDSHKIVSFEHYDDAQKYLRGVKE